MSQCKLSCLYFVSRHPHVKDKWMSLNLSFLLQSVINMQVWNLTGKTESSPFHSDIFWSLVMTDDNHNKPEMFIPTHEYSHRNYKRWWKGALLPKPRHQRHLLQTRLISNSWWPSIQSNTSMPFDYFCLIQRLSKAIQMSLGLLVAQIATSEHWRLLHRL